MKARKPVPTKSKIELRQPAEPLARPERPPLPPDHPVSQIFDAVRMGQMETATIEPVRDTDPSELRTGPPVVPVPVPDPSTLQTPPAAEPVAVTDGATSPKRTRPSAEPVRVTSGFCSYTNHVLDDLLPTLDPPDAIILVRLYRLTRGHHQARCRVSRNTLTAKTRVKKTRLLVALATLEERGFIRRLPDEIGGTDIYGRGMNIEMLLPGADADPSATRTRPRDEPNKKELKKDIQKGDAPRRCDLCRQSGGFIYPEGFGGPVAKCDHGEGK